MPYVSTAIYYASKMRIIKVALGWVIGLEPTTSRATIWHSSQLNYTHRLRK